MPIGIARVKLSPPVFGFEGRKGNKSSEAAARKRAEAAEAEASKRKERQQLELLMMGDKVLC